jgi:glyoxylase-like metal-dependent hydrolase (beta-lactamase superfamily II)
MIHVLDTLQLGRRGVIAATALETNDGIALFDTGAESTFDNIAAELQRIGANESDVRHVFVSHIHFDHAGAAWRFAAAGATVYVHRRGAAHLIEPTRLVESATRIFGDQMNQLWGRVEPVAAERVRVVEDGAVIRIAPFAIRAIETPGHATHHHVYTWDDVLFGGDIAGVRLGHGPPIPPFVPPELHVESWLESIDKMRTLNPAKLYLPHFGEVNGDLPSHFNQLEERVRRWSNWFGERIRDGDVEAQLIPAFADYEHADLRAHGADDELVSDYETADPSYMAVTASLRYWRKFHSTVEGATTARF